jgi:Glycosyl transferases group 1
MTVIEFNTLRAQLGLEQTVTLADGADQNQVIRWWPSTTVEALPSELGGHAAVSHGSDGVRTPDRGDRRGGSPEMVQHGRMGLLVPPGDSHAMADALERLLSSPTERERMGRVAREVAVARFSMTHQVDRLLQVWTSALERRA